ncbi:MAG: hypothetical protein NCW75_10340 [Phycisphaera sp.]|nr:MAG: hypothetical protein NCW75_10340 [Phycisphaera sp.]
MKRLISFFPTLWYVLTLRCEEADRIRANFTDPATTRAQKAGERMHSAMCGSCRAARRAMRQIGEALDDFDSVAQPTPMPDDTRQRMVERLRERDGK